jgi:hypothetical protein
VEDGMSQQRQMEVMQQLLQLVQLVVMNFWKISVCQEHNGRPVLFQQNLKCLPFHMLDPKETQVWVTSGFM